MTDQCGAPCELTDEEVAEAAVDEAMTEVLQAAPTERLIEALKARGYTKVILEAD